MTSTPMSALENSKTLWPGWERTPKISLHDEHCKHELHCCIIHAYHHEGKLLEKLMAKPFKTPSCELADIVMNHFAIQNAWEQVSHSSKPVDATCHNRCQAAHTSHNSNGHMPAASSKDCPNCT